MNAPRHALVVEDLDFWQDALREVLADAGYRVWVAASYAQALAALAENEFHLAVIDPVLNEVNRRNRDGLRVLQHILDERPDMVAVVVTSSDANRIRREVAAMSPEIPILWKDEWDEERFLAIVCERERG
jgi:DNA-binding NtrC family response regulator